MERKANHQNGLRIVVGTFAVGEEHEGRINQHFGEKSPKKFFLYLTSSLSLDDSAITYYDIFGNVQFQLNLFLSKRDQRYLQFGRVQGYSNLENLI